MRVEDFDFGVGVGVGFGAGGEARGGGGGGVEEVVGDVGEVAEVGEGGFAVAGVADEFFGGVEAPDAAREAGAFGRDGVVPEVEGVGGGVWGWGWRDCGGGGGDFAVEEEDAADGGEGGGLWGDGREEGLEDGCREGFEVFGDDRGGGGAFGGGWGGEVVHDKEGWGEVFFAAGFGVLLRFLDVFAQGVFLDTEVEGWAAGSDGEAEVGVAGGGAREEEEVGYAQWAGHGGVVAEPVGSSFLQNVSE